MLWAMLLCFGSWSVNSMGLQRLTLDPQAPDTENPTPHPSKTLSPRSSTPKRQKKKTPQDNRERKFAAEAARRYSKHSKPDTKSSKQTNEHTKHT